MALAFFFLLSRDHCAAMFFIVRRCSDGKAGGSDEIDIVDFFDSAGGFQVIVDSHGFGFVPMELERHRGKIAIRHDRRVINVRERKYEGCEEFRLLVGDSHDAFSLCVKSEGVERNDILKRGKFWKGDYWDFRAIFFIEAFLMLLTGRNLSKSDGPRSLVYQLELLKSVGFANVEVLHKNSVFAAFGAVRG